MPSRRPTSREIEIKLRVNDVPALLRKLESLGCLCRGRVFERNTLYDTHSHDLRRHGRLLRIRIEVPARSPSAPAGRGRVVITSKFPAASHAIRHFKERFERELAVSAERSWDTAFQAIGFRRAFIYEKYRTSYRHKDLHLDLDETPVGTFLELEGSPRAIDSCSRAIGFSRSDYIRGTYWDLLQENNRRTGRNSRNMLFTSQKSRKNLSKPPLFA